MMLISVEKRRIRSAEDFGVLISASGAGLVLAEDEAAASRGWGFSCLFPRHYGKPWSFHLIVVKLSAAFLKVSVILQ